MQGSAGSFARSDAVEHQVDERLGELAAERGVALQQPERRGAAERIDHEVDVDVAPQLAALDRAAQPRPSDLAPTLREFGEEGGARVGIDLRLRDEPDEGGAGDGLRLEPYDRVHDLLEVARDMAGVGLVELAA